MFTKKSESMDVKNEDSLDFIEKKPINGGTKHKKSSKKAKYNVKRKKSLNKKKKRRASSL